MADHCCAGAAGKTALNDPRWRRVLWLALLLNAAMFAVEVAAGMAADSHALQADALDFLGDAANYAISLGVAGMALAWRARAALAKGLTMLLFGLWVAGSAIHGLLAGVAPEPVTMGLVGTIALAVNAGVALMLYRYRAGDANMRSVWICSRNDALGNLAVMLAALGVAGTGAAWPDLLVAGVMGMLALSGAWTVLRQARAEIRESTAMPTSTPTTEATRSSSS